MVWEPEFWSGPRAPVRDTGLGCHCCSTILILPGIFGYKTKTRDFYYLMYNYYLIRTSDCLLS